MWQGGRVGGTNTHMRTFSSSPNPVNPCPPKYEDFTDMPLS